MADDQSLSQKISNVFTGAAGQRRARIDARTVGFAAEDDPNKVVWMGMTPAPGKTDGWYVIRAEEEPNKYLSQVDKDERLVQIVKVIGNDKDGPLSFEKAVEYLAVWEFSSTLKGVSPVDSQDRDALGKHYFKDMLMRHGYLVDTTGTLARVQDILPGQVGKFLKTDLDALEQYQDGLRGANILNELIQAHDPIFVSETTLDDDLASFGDIAVFDKMQLFSSILVKYADIKLKQVQDFYADPTVKATEDLPALMSKDAFFDQKMVDRINEVKGEMAGYIVRFFHFDNADFDKDIDLNDRELRKELLKNPDAQETLNYLDHKVQLPLQEQDVDTILFLAARSLYYFREMLKDSPQKDAMERKGVYKQGDIDDLLNYLDLLDIKYAYRELASAAVALPGSSRAKELNEKKEAFKERVDQFKEKLKSTQDYSDAMEKQVDGFIRTGTPIYMIDRIAALPDKMANAKKYICDRLLPPPPGAAQPAPQKPEGGPAPGKKFSI